MKKPMDKKDRRDMKEKKEKKEMPVYGKKKK